MVFVPLVKSAYTCLHICKYTLYTSFFSRTHIHIVFLVKQTHGNLTDTDGHDMQWQHDDDDVDDDDDGDGDDGDDENEREGDDTGE